MRNAARRRAAARRGRRLPQEPGQPGSTSGRAVADSVRDIKANSSRWLRETFPALGDFAWQRGYAAFTVSESQIDRVYRYIADQEVHHRKRSFENEFKALLKSNRLALDPKHRWG